MTQPGRKFTKAGSGYKYGFNGQEKSDDVTTGNYTDEYWEYDSRIGRRCNVDPVIKIWESGYSCFANNPLILNDRDNRNPGDPQKPTTEKGDNLSLIGKKSGVSVDNLAKWNSLKDKNKIGVGQSLIVSDPTKPEALKSFETYPDFGASTGYTLTNTKHAIQTESTTALSGFGVGRLQWGAMMYAILVEIC